jgi:hypothetical protein
MADLNSMAFRVIQATTDPQPNLPVESAAQQNGRQGGLKGGPARAAKLTVMQRREQARKAARARWAKRDKP